MAGRPYDSRSGESDEHRKGWKRCGCRIYISGTVAVRDLRLYAAIGGQA